MTPTIEPHLAGPWPPAAELVQAELDAYLDAAGDPSAELRRWAEGLPGSWPRRVADAQRAHRPSRQA